MIKMGRSVNLYKNLGIFFIFIWWVDVSWASSELKISPDKLSLPINSSATLAVTLGTISVDATWSKSSIMGDIGSLSTEFGSVTVLKTGNLPAVGTITATYQHHTCSITVDVGKIDLLNKVIKNSSQITTSIATITQSLSITNTFFSHTTTAKLIFKSPDKLKITIFDKHDKPLQTQIYFDKYMTLIDEEGRRYTKDISGYIQDLNLPNFMFQLDLDKFLEEHDISFNHELSTPATNTYTLDIIPKKHNEYYTKIRYSIDYSKGLLTRQEMFNENTCFSSHETKKAQQINDVWIATEIEQKKWQLGHEIVSGIEYKEVIINTEVDDSEFE